MIPDIATEVRLLLHAAADDSNLDSIRCLYQLVDSGLDGCVLLLQVCFDQVLLNHEELPKSKYDLLSAIFRYCMGKTYFTTCFCQALTPIAATHDDGLLKTLSNVLELSPAERVGIGLALSDSGNSALKLKGQQFSIAQIEGLCSNPLQSEPDDQIHDIVVFLHQTDGLSKHMDTFNSIISLLKSQETPFFAPNLYNKFDIQSRHLDMCFGSMDYDSELLLSEIEKEITMADIITELGYGCTVDSTHCKEILSIFKPLDDVLVSKLVGAVIGTHNGLVEAHNTYDMFVSAIRNSDMNDSAQFTTWNTDVLVDSVNELAPSTNWVHVMENLDHEGFNIPDEAAFCLLMSIYARACKEPFPLHAFCGSLWMNTEGQISFLKHAVSVPTDTFTFSHCSKQLAFPDSDCLIQGNYAWFCLDLLEVLCQLAEVGHTVSVRSILEYPLRHCPELLLVGLGHVNTAYNLLQYEVQSRVFPAILKDATKHNVVNYLWQINPYFNLRGFVDAHSDPDCLLRIVDVCQDLKILSAVLDSAPYAFSIKLVVAASRKDHIHLEKWLTEKLHACKDDFLQDCVSFLKETMNNASCALEGTIQESQAVVMNIYWESCPHFIKVLQSQSGHLLPNQKMDELRKLYASYYELRNHDSVVREIPTSEVGSDDVEIETNAYFHQMFSGQISIAAIVQMLSRFKYSPEKREQLIFNCMISNLFEEYKFFPKYPDKDLKLSALLFGSLIKHRLVSRLELGIALRSVLDALRESVDSKMFIFGTTALEQFMDRLIEWPEYCNHILQISHLCGAHTELVSAIERALARISLSQNDLSVNISVSAEQHVTGSAPMEPIETTVQPSSLPSPHHSTSVSSAVRATGFSHPQSSSGLPRQPSNATGFGTSLNIGTLVAAAEQRDTPIEYPPSEVQDKIMFMINNISVSNMEAKAKEFNEVLPEHCYPWFAQFMIMKRASIEPNFHDLYLKFFHNVNSRSLNKEVLKATYENCKILLRSDLIKSSSEERSLLKNLGSWLGKFTIGRNQALLAKEIDPKALIVEAYEKGLMITVIPFTSKILEPCRSSIAYRPPNPWTMGILSLLSEIYNLPNLKMNLKFDIEVLFKNLGMDLKDVNPTSLLKDRVREVEGNPDFSKKDIAASQTPVVAEISSGIILSTNHVELQSVINSTSCAMSLPNYATPARLPSNSVLEDDKVDLMMPKHVSSHTWSQVSLSETPLASLSPSPFSLSQLVELIPHDEICFKLSPKLGSLGPQLQYSKIMDAAFNKAIKEILCPVVKISVGTAIQTTKKLILKDYALESDNNTINRSAHSMVKTLAGRLAYAYCKEPLRVRLTSHLKSQIQTLASNNENIKQLIDVLINDNLDRGCAIIVSVAMGKAIEMIDGEIAMSFSQQKKLREATGSAHCDAFTTYAHGRFSHEPEARRPKHEHLSVAQQQFYEDFAHEWQSHSKHVDASGSTQSGTATCSSNFNVPRAYSPNSASATFSYFTTAQTAPVISKSSELASEELIAEPSSVYPAQAGTCDSSALHGGSIGVTSTFPPANNFPVGGTMDLSEMSPLVTIDVGCFGTVLPKPLNTSDALKMYQHISQKLDAVIMKDGKDAEIQSVIAEVPDILLRCVKRDEAALVVAQKVFKSLCDNTSNSAYIMWLLATLVAIRGVCKLVVKELTSWVIYSDEKLNIEIISGLIRSELLNLGEYNSHLAKLIDGGRNKVATEFAMSLVQTLIAQGSTGISELHNVVDALAKISRIPDSLQQLIEIARTNASNATGFGVGNNEKIKQVNDKKVARLFTDWCHICDYPISGDVAYSRFVMHLQQTGVLMGDDNTERFFHIFTELAVTHSLVSDQIVATGGVSQQSSEQLKIKYFPIDSYSKLVAMVLKYSSAETGPNKYNLLSKILSGAVRIIQKDSEEKKASFNPRPYFRLFISLLHDLISSDLHNGGANFQVLIAFANAFHVLQPLRIPAWSFAWLELVSHRTFMPRVLMCNSQKGWPFFQQLLVDLFKFMEPYLRSAELGEAMHLLYKGTMRVLLVLLHDFPEFLCNYHSSFCDVIPSSCIQMRNVILSAYPKNMRVPDPSTPNLKIDLLPEISIAPQIMSDVEGALKSKQMKTKIDEYFKRREGSLFLSDLKQKLLLPQNETSVAGTRYNVPLINSLVLYVGIKDVQQLQQTESNASASAQHVNRTAPMDIFQTGTAAEFFRTLVTNLDTEGRYLVLNAIANQLRYPNIHTRYFSSIILYLFSEATEEIIQDEITRVLFKRLMMRRPYPWGSLFTFFELIKNPRYNFWR